MNEDVQLDDAAKEAVHAAKNAAQAIEVARQVQFEHASADAAQKAAMMASEQVRKKIVDEVRMGEIMRDAVQHVLTQGTDSERELIIARVPYICEEIRNINVNLERIVRSQTYSPLVEKLVFGFVIMIMVAVVGGLIGLVIVR